MAENNSVKKMYTCRKFSEYQGEYREQKQNAYLQYSQTENQTGKKSLEGSQRKVIYYT